MAKIKVYLDNCAYNRPYDDQTQPKVTLETLAKLHIQELALKREIDIVWSYILKFENSRNIFAAKRAAIAQREKVSVCFVQKSDSVIALARQIEASGIKPADSLHIACAITAHCDYIVTVDKCILIKITGLSSVIRLILSIGGTNMTNNTILLDKGIKCLTDRLGLLEAEQFIYLLLSQPFDYTEWWKDHLFTGMSLDEISDAADAYCRENP